LFWVPFQSKTLLEANAVLSKQSVGDYYRKEKRNFL
jgi:hypothetical protein